MAGKDSQLDVIHAVAKQVRAAKQPPQMLVIDDKYLIDGILSQSTHIRRLCDLNQADLGDHLRIRAHPTEVVRATGPNRLLPGFRLMWLINTTPEGEGGWMTTSAQTGFGYTEKTDGYGVATPIVRVGQIGDIVILTADDEIKVTPDGDSFTLANVRHDAHFHYAATHDGRIYFTTTAPGTEPTGPPKIGEMVCDPAKANADTTLGKESGEWRPQIKETFPIDTIINGPAGGYDMPLFRDVNLSVARAAVFPASGSPKKGWTFAMQVPDTFGTGWHVGLYLEYSATNASGSDKVAVFDVEYVVVSPDGSSMSVAAPTSRSAQITLTDGWTEDELHAGTLSLVSGADLSDGDMIIGKVFFRDTDDAADTFAGDVLIEGFKVTWTDVAPS